MKAANAFTEAFDEYKTSSTYERSKPWYSTSMFTNLRYNIEAKNIFGSNITSYIKYNDETMASVREKIKEIDLAEESLLIKLTYEKDIETIRAMLAEYDITI